MQNQDLFKSFVKDSYFTNLLYFSNGDVTASEDCLTSSRSSSSSNLVLTFSETAEPVVAAFPVKNCILEFLYLDL